MIQFRPIVSLFVLAVATGAQAQVPTVQRSIPAQALAQGGAAVTIDLRNFFVLPDVTGQVVQFDTAMGKYNIELFSADAPLNTANFLSYVNSNAYNNTLVHRSVAGFVVQGGGYTYSGTTTHIPTAPPVQNEFKRSNLRGTLAMAKVGGNPNSATSEWFINLADNSANLDNQNGGFTVFARVLGTGMSVADAIAALPTLTVNFSNGTSLPNMPLRNYTSGQTLGLEHLVPVTSAAAIPIYPATGGGTAVVSFAIANSTNPGAVNASLSGSTLTLNPSGSGGSNLTLRATDTNGNTTETTFAVSISPGPVFTTQPVSQSASAGGSVTLSAVASGASSYQWQRNGVDLAGATNASLTLSNLQPAEVGVYRVRASDGINSRTSESAIVGLSSTVKLLGAGQEFPDIAHPNGNIFDQILMQTAAISVTADNGQAIRISFIDLTNDIVQVEFSGAGTLTLILDNASGPAAPTNYNQPTVAYMKGHPSIFITGANNTTNLGVFSVGRATAFDPTGTYNILAAPSATNVPANNGSPLFAGHTGTTYDGFADVGLVAIASSNGQFGGVRGANASFFSSSGLTGVFAPGVKFSGPVFVGDIAATADGTPTIMLGNASDVRITGGDLQPGNGRAVQVDGMTKLQMAAGTNSHGVGLAAQPLRARLERSGIDVTDQLVAP
ncbi:MAG: peptidylprolyl isomerase [Opitutaceae bacterium]